MFIQSELYKCCLMFDVIIFTWHHLKTNNFNFFKHVPMKQEQELNATEQNNSTQPPELTPGVSRYTQ